MLLHTSFELNLVIAVKIKHCTLPLQGALWGICSVWCSGIQGIYAQLRGVDLPGDLPIWALIVNIQNCHSDQVADLPGG